MHFYLNLQLPKQTTSCAEADVISLGLKMHFTKGLQLSHQLTDVDRPVH